MNRHTAVFSLALMAQVALLAAVPWGRGGDESAGRTIWLKATARNQHDLMQGPYLDLDYEISDPHHFAGTGELRSGETVYAIVRETDADIWKGLQLRDELPADLRAGFVAIRGETVDRGLQIHAFLHEEADGTWMADSVVVGGLRDRIDRDREDRTVAGAWVRRQNIAYRGIESCFVPESQRQRLEEDLRAHPDEVFAQVRVSASGGAVLLQLRIQDRLYDF